LVFLVVVVFRVMVAVVMVAFPHLLGQKWVAAFVKVIPENVVEVGEAVLHPLGPLSEVSFLKY
jgi:hypothetical protein